MAVNALVSQIMHQPAANLTQDNYPAWL